MKKDVFRDKHSLRWFLRIKIYRWIFLKLSLNVLSPSLIWLVTLECWSLWKVCFGTWEMITRSQNIWHFFKCLRHLRYSVQITLKKLSTFSERKRWSVCQAMNSDGIKKNSFERVAVDVQQSASWVLSQGRLFSTISLL